MIYPDDAFPPEGFSRADLLAALAVLQKARVEGVRRARYSGNGVERETEFRTDAELAAAIADIEKRLAGPRRMQTVIIRPTKGWLP